MLIRSSAPVMGSNMLARFAVAVKWLCLLAGFAITAWIWNDPGEGKMAAIAFFAGPVVLFGVVVEYIIIGTNREAELVRRQQAIWRQEADLRRREEIVEQREFQLRAALAAGRPPEDLTIGDFLNSASRGQDAAGSDQSPRPSE